MSSHQQSNFIENLIDTESGSYIKTYRHPHCPGWRIILTNSNIPLATSDTGIKGYFIGNTSFQNLSEVLNSRQKKGPAQLSEFLNVVLTVWHTYCEGNEECAVRLDRLFAEELDTYVVEETNITRELEKSTREWATLYMLQTRSNYANLDTRAVALSDMFRERTATTDRK
jgi:septin family protein